MNEPTKKSIFTSPSGKSYLFPFILITSLFLMWGIAHGLLDTLNKHFQEAFTMSKAESGLVQFSTYIAYALVSIPAGLFMKKYGYKKGIILGLFLFAIGAFGFVPAALLHSANPFLIALFVVACGLCVLETAANPYSTTLGPKESAAQRINLSQSFNGLGWVLGPFIGGLLILGAPEGDTMALSKPYLILGSCVLIIAILFFFTKLPDIAEKDESPKIVGDAVVTKSMWAHKHFLLAVIAQFLYVAAQTGIFSFFINYVMELDPAITKVKAARFLAFGGMLLFMIGRMSGSIIMSKFRPNKLLAIYSLMCVIAMVLVIMQLGKVSLYALYTSFFFMSIMFPTIFAMGVSKMGSYTQKASSYIVMGVAGGAFAPMLMGYIGKQTMAIGFIIPLFCFLFILFYGLKGYKM
ncbi:MAG: sugar MFS transporter [Candidatus Azobacteroides sp.]|nr:sugar MFS transporter [Candidatus Azobacteroides sp.]